MTRRQCVALCAIVIGCISIVVGGVRLVTLRHQAMRISVVPPTIDDAGSIKAELLDFRENVKALGRDIENIPSCSPYTPIGALCRWTGETLTIITNDHGWIVGMKEVISSGQVIKCPSSPIRVPSDALALP